MKKENNQSQKCEINTQLNNIVLCNEQGEFIKNIYSKKCTMCFGDGYVYKISTKRISCPQCGGTGEIIIG